MKFLNRCNFHKLFKIGENIIDIVCAKEYNELNEMDLI